MSQTKLKVTARGKEAGFIAQGEYHADLSKATVEVFDVFAEHLIIEGYAERFAKDQAKIEKAREVPDNSIEFVERETAALIDSVQPAQPNAPAIPTEEITAIMPQQITKDGKI